MNKTKQKDLHGQRTLMAVRGEGVAGWVKKVKGDEEDKLSVM